MKIQKDIYLANPRPFLKWAGGKTQLLNELSKRLPLSLVQNGVIERYVEPFVGGGAFFFFLKRNYKIKESFLIDKNKDLIVAYQVIKNDVDDLISELENIETIYTNLHLKEKEKFYYKIRDIYNIQKRTFNYEKYSNDQVKRITYMIFLNKTCFNGLYRVNKKGEFNVPFGNGKVKYSRICDKDNLIKVNKALADAEIIYGDFEDSRKYIQKGTLVYLDPPYRPLSDSSSFTKYTEIGFNDDDQIRLSKFFKEMDKKGAFLLLSNSDPKNKDSNDNFFENLYAGYIIERVSAKRYISSNVKTRRDVNELLIRNY